jgi:hypothetical protein
MNDRFRECIKCATECLRLAEVENDDSKRLFFMKLASEWARAAAQTRASHIRNAVARCI